MTESEDRNNNHSEPLAPPLAIREGAYGVLIRENCLLMAHTKSGDRTIINLPGGAIDAGENHAEALIREFEEESGDAVVVLAHLYSSDGTYVNPDYPQNRVKCHYYLVRADSELKLHSTAADVTHFEWFPLDRLPYERMLEVDAAFCRQLPVLLASVKPKQSN